MDDFYIGYLYQLGSLAKNGLKVIMHNTLSASEYGLIDQDEHLPKPNYWEAFLWAKLMGTEVCDAGNESSTELQVKTVQLNGQ